MLFDGGSFEIDGFVRFDGLLSEDVLCGALGECFLDGVPLDRWKRGACPGVLGLAFCEVVLGVLRDLFGAEPFPFQTLNFLRGPGIGLHSDAIHFSSVPVGWVCGVWVALMDVGLDCGPLEYFPGSHLLPVVSWGDVGLDVPSDMDEFRRFLGVYSRFLERRVVDLGLRGELLTCSRGTVFVWHGNLLHRSVSPMPGTLRASQVTHYYFDVPGVRFTVPAFNRDKVDAFALRDHFQGGN